MPTYDAALFTPAAPLARVRLRHTENETEVTEVPMLLDTGADVSLVPRACVVALGLSLNPTNQYELVGFDGTISAAPVAYLELHMLGCRFRGQFLVIEQDWGIVGRNILNQIVVVLNGPRLVWDLQR